MASKRRAEKKESESELSSIEDEPEIKRKPEVHSELGFDLGDKKFINDEVSRAIWPLPVGHSRCRSVERTVGKVVEECGKKGVSRCRIGENVLKNIMIPKHGSRAWLSIDKPDEDLRYGPRRKDRGSFMFLNSLLCVNNGCKVIDETVFNQMSDLKCKNDVIDVDVPEKDPSLRSEITPLPDTVAGYFSPAWITKGRAEGSDGTEGRSVLGADNIDSMVMPLHVVNSFEKLCQINVNVVEEGTSHTLSKGGDGLRNRKFKVYKERVDRKELKKWLRQHCSYANLLELGTNINVVKSTSKRDQRLIEKIKMKVDTGLKRNGQYQNADMDDCDREEIVTVRVKDWRGSERSVAINQKKEGFSLKKKISKLWNISESEFWLMIDGKKFNEDASLKENRVKDGSPLRIMLRLKGGMDENEEELKEKLNIGLNKKRAKKGKLTRLRKRAMESLEKEFPDDPKEKYYDEYLVMVEELTDLKDIGRKLNQLGIVAELENELKHLEIKYDEMDELVKKKVEDSIFSEKGSDVGQEPKLSKHRELSKFERLTIPTFEGSIEEYEGWRAMFDACIGNSSGEKEEKLLYLRRYLKGEPLKMIENLGYTSKAYDVALEKIADRYGGKEREYRTLVNRVELFRPVRETSSEDIEEFIIMLDQLIVRLSKGDKDYELGSGFIYQRLLAKLPERMVIRYMKWTKDHVKEENVRQLLEWSNEEISFLRRAKEILGNHTKHAWTNNKDVKVKNTFDEIKKRSFFVDEHKKNTASLCAGSSSMKEEGNGVSSSLQCLMCSDEHYLDQCTIFRTMKTMDRQKWVKEKNLCFNCLKKNHKVSECRRNSMCRVTGCIRKHSYWLHEIEGQSSLVDNSRTLICRDKLHPPPSEGWFSLRTIPIYLKHENKKIKVNALLDDASTTSYVSKQVVMELGLVGRDISAPIKVIGNRTEVIPAKAVTMSLESLDGVEKREFKALSIKSVTGDMRVIDWKQVSTWKHLQNIEFPALGLKRTVDVLIGSDYLELQRCVREVAGDRGQPIARLTPLGWTCVGGPNLGQRFEHQTNLVRTYFAGKDELNDQIKHFWEIDDVEYPCASLSQRDLTLCESTRATMVKLEGRYEVKIPWKDNTGSFPDSYMTAERRLFSLKKKLNSDPNLRREYESIIHNYEQKGYIKEVLEKVDGKSRWLLPHFPVVKRDRLTTKVRIVFDAAAKSSGSCLNDFIETGPKLQNDLFEVLLRFRKNSIALVCDIAEMYLQVGMFKEDRPYLRFLWEDEKGKRIYEFTRLVFGLNTSPYLAQFVTQEHARENQNRFPRAAETVIKSTYMDDSLDSVGSEKEAIILINDLKELWRSAGMEAKKWMTNSPGILKSIATEDRANMLKLEDVSNITVKTLGLKWLAESDHFSFDVRPPPEECLSKRKLLSWIARIFDPLGMLCAFVIRGKIIMQAVWLIGIDWDDPLPPELEKKARCWMQECVDLSEIRIPRCLIQHSGNTWSLHVFSDASNDAYGAVVYLRENQHENIKINFVTAKAKVAPVQSISIPRMELMGACLGVKLVKKVLRAISGEMEQVTFWTDSMDVLYWIKQVSRLFKPFVANRVGTIQVDTSTNQWRYVPTQQNPADLLSRGMTGEDCYKYGLWWEGPAYLKKDPKEWPITSLAEKDNKNNEQRLCTLATTQGMKEEVKYHIDCFIPSTYSCWRRLIRVRAWVRRFSWNCSIKVENRKSGELSSEELQASELDILSKEQQERFPEEMKCLQRKEQVRQTSRICHLNPMIDDDEIMRSNSRIVNVEFLPWNTKYPIILDSNSWITHLIIGDYHKQREHYAGVNHVLSDISEKFWILKARQEIKKYSRRCVICQKKKGLGLTQIMAPLPEFRFKEPLRPFGKTAVDYAGPFETIQGRGRIRTKRYVCLFTCLQTRAVHIELSYGLDTDSFIRAMMRFIGRRGKPEIILSDNGTNFVGATGSVTTIKVDNYKMQRVLSEKEIRWIFNPPSGPHFGGVFESMIKSVKKAMVAVIEKADLTDEELSTVLIRVEEMLNARPLTVQTTDEKEITPLTPNHFLLNSWCGIEVNLSPNRRVSMRSRWRRVLEVAEHVWKRWMKEVVPMLCGRSKWKIVMNNLKIGDVVCVLDKKNEIGSWPLGRVLEFWPGKDGNVRVVKIKCEGKEIIRPIVKLLYLEVNNREEKKEDEHVQINYL